MRFFASIVLASTLIGGSAYAKNDQVNRGNPPKWVIPSEPLPVPAETSGLLFVRRQDTLVHLDEQGQEQYVGYLIKILHPNALQLGNLSIAWNPESGAPTVHTIKLHRGAETIDVLQTASFETLRREGQLEAAMLDGVLTGVVRISDLRVGDELEVAYTTRFSDPTLGNANSGLLFLQPSTAPGRFRLGLSWVEGQKPNIKMTDDMAAVVQKDERSVGFRFDNPANLALAKDAPPRYNWKRVVEYSDFPDWNAISQRFAGLYMKASKLSDTSPLKREAKQIASAHLSPFDRASAALKLVQQDVRYIYVGLGNGNLTPVAADDTWQRRYGDCKGKTALLLGLLAELGIDAEPVLASNAGSDDGLDQRLPSLQMFDHVLVRARIDGKLYFLDATLPPVVPPSFNPVFRYRWVLPLRMKGSSIERLEWRPATVPDELTLYEIDARTGFSTPARITSTTITRGIKGLEQQFQLSALTSSALLDAMRQQMVGDTWQVIDDVKWRFDQKAQASVLTIIGTGTVDWDDDAKGAKSLALPGGGFYPPAKRIRAIGQEQDLPYYNESEYSCNVTTVRLPSETQARQWSFKPGIDTRLFGKNYYRAFELRDGAIRMIRGGRVEQQEIDAASAKRDNDRIASFDNSMAWIYYNPSERGSPARGDKAVPATYDIDWTTDGVPCVSSATAK